MNTYDIGIGTKLELENIGKSGVKTSKIYISQLVDIIDEKSFLLSCPLAKSQYIIFHAGNNVDVAFIDQGSNCYSFTVRVDSTEKIDNILALKVTIISDFKKVQRRKFYRLKCCIEAKYSMHQHSHVGKTLVDVLPGANDCKNAIIKDISGNGACMITDEKIAVGTVIDVELELVKKLRIKSKIVRSSRIEGVSPEKYETAINFLNIIPKHREAVIKYIHDRQRILLNARQIYSDTDM